MKEKKLPSKFHYLNSWIGKLIVYSIFIDAIYIVRIKSPYNDGTSYIYKKK